MSEQERIEELLACLSDGLPLCEVYPLIRELKQGCGLRLDGNDLVLETSHPSLQYEHFARIDTRRPLSLEENNELTEHLKLVLGAWLRELKRKSKPDAFEQLHDEMKAKEASDKDIAKAWLSSRSPKERNKLLVDGREEAITRLVRRCTNLRAKRKKP